jgi:DNA-binding NarL/FixJ family response regulator
VITNILLMSADKEFLRQAHQALEGLPVKVVGECARFRRAMDIMHEAPCRIVIIDMFLPESSGIELVKQIKQQDEKIVLVLLSRMRGRSMLDRAFRHGATDILPYPMQVDTLRQTVLHRLSRLSDDSMIIFQNQ